MLEGQRKKLLSPWVTKKKKKKILDSIGMFSINSVDKIKDFLSGDNSEKAFKVLYDINYEGLKEFYKSVIETGDISFLKTIPLQFVSSDFLKDFDLYERRLFEILSSDLDEKIKTIIYLDNQDKIDNRIGAFYGDFDYKNCLQDNMYSKVRDIAFNKLTNTKKVELDVFCNPNISDEIKGRLFDIQKEDIEKYIAKYFRDNRLTLSVYNASELFDKNMYNKIIDMGIEKCINVPIKLDGRYYLDAWSYYFFKNPNVSTEVKEKLFNFKENEIRDILSENSTRVLITSLSYDNMYVKILDLVLDIIEKDIVNEQELDELLKKSSTPVVLKERMFEKRIKDIIKLFPNGFFDDLVNSNSFEDNYNSIQDKVIEIVIANFESANDNQKKEFIDLIKQISFNYRIIFFNRVFGLDEENSKVMSKLIYYCNEDISKFINDVQNTKQLLGINHVELDDFLKFYRGDISKFISNVEKIKYFFNTSFVDINKFIQYSLNNSYDWLEGVVAIVDNNQMNNFVNVKNSFFSKFYDGNLSDNRVIDNLNSLIKNYNRYPELLLSIANIDRELTSEERQQIEFLLNKNEILSGEDKPVSIEDCNRIKDKFRENCNRILENIENMDIATLKDVLSMMLFNDTIINMKGKLKTYGNTEEFIKLKFNNRYNDFNTDINIMEVLTTMIEELINCDDIIRLRVIAKNVLEKYEMSCEVSQIFSNYEERMRRLYEYESNINLTRINDSTHKKVFNEEKSNNYGVEFFDFSDKNYILLAHKISASESVEQIVNGYARGGRNTICLSAISYRNQVYYQYNGSSSIIFGYDEIPKGSFIASSISNMGSNGKFAAHSTEGRELARTQRGILEISTALKGNNSEILCFRDGLKPKYIILPGGRNPTANEIEIAKKYGLKFALTQNVRERIDNPVIIEEDIMEKNEKRSQDLSQLKQMRDSLLNIGTVENPRKIAIFTDAHGLFEPTLAILEDARRNGIDEIYSLGDNIGTGPNPSEVLDLLEQYGVKSVVGNHELYVTEGVKAFQEHLRKSAGYSEAERNSTWTRNQLTEEQKSRIAFYPKMIEILIGNQKILLCHSINDLNNGKLIVPLEDYNKIFQGHIHFREKRDNVQTLRGAGIGYDGNTDINKAYYVVASETPDGGYEIEERWVPFDTVNLKHSINLSDLSDEDKNKISNWSQGKSR